MTDILIWLAIGLAIGAGTIAAIVGIYAATKRSRKGTELAADEETTYLLRDLNGGGLVALKQPEEIHDIEKRLIKPPTDAAGYFAYRSYDELTNSYDQRALMQPTGEISLRQQAFSLGEFRAVTKDRHHMAVFVKIWFRLDRDRLHETAKFDDFGKMLEERIKALIREEFGERNDEELRGQRSPVRTRLLEQLQAFESEGGDTRTAPLGITVFDLSFDFEERRDVQTRYHKANRPSANGSATLQDPATSRGQTVPTEIDVNEPAVDFILNNGLERLTGAMHFTEQDIDRVADVFKNRTPEQTEAILRLMELQTRQNIVEILALSRTTFPVTTKELGIEDGRTVTPSAPRGDPLANGSTTSYLDDHRSADHTSFDGSEKLARD
ncbi:MAG: hypothetical protein AAGJ29_05500 [Pseudomonadota bacterium]